MLTIQRWLGKGLEANMWKKKVKKQTDSSGKIISHSREEEDRIGRIQKPKSSPVEI